MQFGMTKYQPSGTKINTLKIANTKILTRIVSAMNTRTNTN